MADYIEKQAAIESALAAVPRDDYFDRQIEVFINLIPPADVRPVVHGKWIEKQDKDGKTYGVCSNCGYKQYAGHLKYCPECGGKMDGPNQ